eukprot:207918_1
MASSVKSIISEFNGRLEEKPLIVLESVKRLLFESLEQLLSESLEHILFDLLERISFPEFLKPRPTQLNFGELVESPQLPSLRLTISVFLELLALLCGELSPALPVALE